MADYSIYQAKIKSLKFTRNHNSNSYCLNELAKVDRENRMFKGAALGIFDKTGEQIHEGDVIFTGNNHTMYREFEIVEYDGGGFSPFAIPGWECTLDPEETEIMFSIYD